MNPAENIAQVFGVYWPNLIAQVVLFVVVYLILRKYAFKPVVDMFEERRRRILFDDPGEDLCERLFGEWPESRGLEEIARGFPVSIDIAIRK